MNATATTEAEILSRVVWTDGTSLSAEAAQALLSLRFPPEDVSRMNELANKARDGLLTPDEQTEVQNYERVGHLVALLQSKARLVTRNHAGL